ncbi:MAG: hypothetical protein ACM3ZC_12175 [Bacteroidota bacterium]
MDLTQPGLSFSMVDGTLYPLNAAIQGRLFTYDLRLGYIPLNWGPAPVNNLSLSPTRGHLMLWMQNDFTGMELIPPFHWEQAYIFLEPRNGAARYMLARRYKIEAGRWRLGYVEAALLTGDFSPWYLNPYPLIPLEVTQLMLQYLDADGGGNEYCNMIMAIDAKYHGDHANGYVSVYVDDLPPTSDWVSHYKLGIQAGLEFTKPLGCEDTRLWLDYTAITRHTYTFYDTWPQGDYVDGGLLLGHPLGPDADLLTARLIWTGSDTYLELQRERHGEGRFPDPMDPVTAQTFELLTGVVETSYWLKGGRTFAVQDCLRLDLELGVAYVENAANEPGAAGVRYSLEARVTYKF